MESRSILRSGGLSGGPAEVASIGRGSSEAASCSGAANVFDLNVAVDLGDEGGLHGSDLNKGVKRKLIDLNEEAVDEDVEAVKKLKRFDLNVEPEEEEEEAAAETETDVSVVQPPPAKVNLPPSSAILDLHGASFLDFISVYAFLRSFSTVLFLSPFEVDEFAASVVSNEPSPLFDAVILSVMRSLRRCTSTSTRSRSRNWDLLDSITWPVFVVEYLSLHKPKHIPGLDLSDSSPLLTDYHSIPSSVKVAILQHLCDDLLQTEVYRSEISKRVKMEESGDCNMKYFSSNGRKKAGKTRSASSSAAEKINGDECFLCKMDGSLICCDSCPAALHSRCAGVVTAELEKDGDWHCPECRLNQGRNRYNLANSTRGDQLLGKDHHGRLYYQVCNYLLVVEQNLCADECSLMVYKRDDLTAVVDALHKSSCVLHETIIHAITEHWNISSHEVQPVTTSSSTKASYEMNLYEFAGMASLIAEKMTSATATGKPEKIMKQQLDIIQGGGKPTLFSWANTYQLNVYLNSKKEKCGWCFACNNARECLFIASDNIQSSSVLGFPPRTGRKKHHDDAMGHIMWIESRLQGLLQDTRSNHHRPENIASLTKLLQQGIC